MNIRTGENICDYVHEVWRNALMYRICVSEANIVTKKLALSIVVIKLKLKKNCNLK